MEQHRKKAEPAVEDVNLELEKYHLEALKKQAERAGYSEKQAAQERIAEYKKACAIYGKQIDNVVESGKKYPERALDSLTAILDYYERNESRPITKEKDPVYVKMRNAVSIVFQRADKEAQRKIHKKVKDLEDHLNMMLWNPRKEVRA